MKTATWGYFAKFDNGVILESDNFKNIYYAVKCELRCEYGHSLFYDYGEVVINEGVRIDWEENGKNYFHYVVINPVLRMKCSSIDRVTNFSVMKEV